MDVMACASTFESADVLQESEQLGEAVHVVPDIVSVSGPKDFVNRSGH